MGGSGGGVGGSGGTAGANGGTGGTVGGTGGGGSGGMVGTTPDAGPDVAQAPNDTGCPGACCVASDCPMRMSMVASCEGYQCKYACAPGAKDCGNGRCIPGGADACCGNSECGECKRCTADRCVNSTNGQTGPGCTGECKACNNGVCSDRTGSCGQGATCAISGGAGSAKQADYCQNGQCRTGATNSCAPYGCSNGACASSCPSGSEVRGNQCVKCGGNGEPCCITKGKCNTGYICGDDLSEPGTNPNHRGKCQPCGAVDQYCCGITPNEQIGRCTQSWSYCGMGGAADRLNYGCIPCGGGPTEEQSYICRNSTSTPCKPGYREDQNVGLCVP
jgi:hypothetical protein